MKVEQQQVTDFMIKAGQECPECPQLPTRAVGHLRLALIQEELVELREALAHDDIVEAYDAILDLLVVTIGTAVALGLEIEPGWQEVHRSNMTKFIDGHKHESGKWVKGPSHSPANLAPIVKAQML